MIDISMSDYISNPPHLSRAIFVAVKQKRPSRWMAFRLLTNPIIFDGVCFWALDFQFRYCAASIC
jgi:hypothetical protein